MESHKSAERVISILFIQKILENLFSGCCKNCFQFLRCKRKKESHIVAGFFNSLELFLLIHPRIDNCLCWLDSLYKLTLMPFRCSELGSPDVQPLNEPNLHNKYEQYFYFRIQVLILG